MYVVTKTGCNKNFLFLPFAGKRIAINKDVLKTGEVFIKYLLLRDLYTVLEANKALSRRRFLLPSSSPRFTWSVFTLLKCVDLKK
jgi:hypothetical protein